MKPLLIRLFVIFLFSRVCLHAQEDDIPSRTLEEVGCGPALLIGVADYDKDRSAFDPLPAEGINSDLDSMAETAHFASRNSWFLKMDIRKYFESIPKPLPAANPTSKSIK